MSFLNGMTLERVRALIKTSERVRSDSVLIVSKSHQLCVESKKLISATEECLGSIQEALVLQKEQP